jgi:hypothetical protein
MKLKREFRLVSDGVRYRIEVFDRPWWRPWGAPRWRRLLLQSSTTLRTIALLWLRELRDEEAAREQGYRPVEER